MYHGEHSIAFFGNVEQVDAEAPAARRDTWRDWHLIPAEKPVFQPPGEEEHWIKVPGRHGQINGSALLHRRPVYTNRTGELRFRISPYWRGNKPALISEITAFLNGYERPCVLRDDPWFYYYGLFDVKQVTPGQSTDEVTISYSLYPFKFERWNGLKAWEWNDFDFDRGVIREGYDVPVGAAAGTAATVAVTGGSAAGSARLGPADTAVLELLPIGNEAQAELEILPGSEAIFNAEMELGDIPFYVTAQAADPAPTLLAEGTYQVLERETQNNRVHFIGVTGPGAFVQCWIETKYLIKGTAQMWMLQNMPSPVGAALLLNGAHVFTAADEDDYEIVTGLRYPVTAAPGTGEDARIRLAKTWGGTAEDEWLPVAPYGAGDWLPLAGNGVLYVGGLIDQVSITPENTIAKIETKEAMPLGVVYINESPALPCRAVLKYRGEIL